MKVLENQHTMSTPLWVFFFNFCCLLLLLLVESKTTLINEASCQQYPLLKGSTTVGVGVVIDANSRVGKEQKVAMEMGVHYFRHCLNLVLHFKDSHGNSARAVSAAIELVIHKHVHAILGTMTGQEATLISEFNKLTENIPIISISTTASASEDSEHMAPKFPSFIHMSNNIIYQIHCIAAIIGHYKWRKVITIHEQDKSFSPNSGFTTLLLDALQEVDSSVENHLAFPSVSSLSDPEEFIEEKLKKLRSMDVKTYVITQSSLEFARILFHKAKILGMMEKDYAWIVSDEIANFLDSVDLSVIKNMQGVVGLKTHYVDTSEYFREFIIRFRRKYRTEYPEDENSDPSIYALRAYDAIWTIANALQNSEGKTDSKEIVNHTLSSDFEGLSGRISFNNGLLSNKPIFQIVNVIGKSYREVALWSSEYGFLEDQTELDGKKMRSGNGVVKKLDSIYWPGNEQTVPIGRTMGSKEKPLRIGVPAEGAFNHFVKVIYHPLQNKTLISGFSIDVFEAAVQQLPYHLYYEFVPYYGTYDEMVAAVHNKSLDAAVGDTEIMADRCVFVEFSHPYIESGLEMVVTEQPGIKESSFIALNAFTKKMWIQYAAMSISTGSIIWLSEYAADNKEFTEKSFLELIGSILWISVTIMSFSQRENIENFASRLVMAAWICVVVVVGASFTAVLSTLMTVPRIQPSVLNIDDLLKTNARVGCNNNSFIDRYLINALHFKPENVQRIASIDDYPKAFKEGEIKAAFFVAPHAKVFLAQYCKGYTTSGTGSKLGGFGFGFRKGSPLATDISEAILKITQSGQVNILEKSMLSFSNCSSSTQEKGDIKLGPGPFSGFFLILECCFAVALVDAVVRLAKKHRTNIHNLVQNPLIRNRIFIWASLVLTKCHIRFGSTFFRKNSVDNLNVAHGDMEIQVAANHNM